MDTPELHSRQRPRSRGHAGALALGITLAVAVLPPPAAAATPAVTVRVGDLDVSRASGAATLHRRLRTAALVVCGERVPRDLARVAAQRRCYAETLAAAVRDVARTRVAATRVAPAPASAAL